jgi:hypothetical protein
MMQVVIRQFHYLAISVIVYLTVFLSSIQIDDDKQSPKQSQRKPYVKKRHRWIRARQLIRLLEHHMAYAWPQIGQYGTTWSEYKTRCVNSRRIRLAQRHITTSRNRTRWKKLLVQELMSMSSVNAYGEPIHQNVTRFDTDSGKIGIENRASACISAFIQDFEGPVRRVNRSIKGFGGESITEVGVGTIVWK